MGWERQAKKRALLSFLFSFFWKRRNFVPRSDWCTFSACCWAFFWQVDESRTTFRGVPISSSASAPRNTRSSKSPTVSTYSSYSLFKALLGGEKQPSWTHRHIWTLERRKRPNDATGLLVVNKVLRVQQLGQILLLTCQDLFGYKHLKWKGNEASLQRSCLGDLRCRWQVQHLFLKELLDVRFEVMLLNAFRLHHQTIMQLT